MGDQNGHDLINDPSLTQRVAIGDPSLMQRVQIDPDQLLDFILAADRDRLLRLTDLRRFNFAFVVNALSLRREFTNFPGDSPPKHHP